MAHKSKHVAYCLDSGYEQHFGVSLTSLLLNYGDASDLEVHVVIDGPSDQFEARLSRLRESFKARITVYRLDETLRQQLYAVPIESYLDHLSTATIFRLALGIILPGSVEQIVYLDSDTVVRSDITALFDVDLEGHVIAGVKGTKTEQHAARLGVANYINAGVLVIDLKQWRQEELYEATVGLIADGETDTPLLDQDAINKAVDGRIKLLPVCWNTMVYDTTDYQLVERAVIAHYNGFKKPWQEWYAEEQGQDYRAYLQVSPWRDVPLQKAQSRVEHRLLSMKQYAEGDYQSAADNLMIVIDRLRNNLD